VEKTFGRKGIDMRKTLGLSIIVKNEEKFMDGFLKNVFEFCDEVVIVDTGSTDKTIDIIKKNPRIDSYEYKWDDDFAKARNFGLDKVKSDWIFVLSPDESISSDYYGKIRSYINGPDVGYAFARANVTKALLNDYKKENDPHYPDHQLRLFPNKKEIRFERRVHECVQGSLARLKIPIYRTDEVLIWHKLYAKTNVGENDRLYKRLTKIIEEERKVK